MAHEVGRVRVCYHGYSFCICVWWNSSRAPPISFAEFAVGAPLTVTVCSPLVKHPLTNEI